MSNASKCGQKIYNLFEIHYCIFSSCVYLEGNPFPEEATNKISAER